MNRILKTPIYNQFYYDFLSGKDDIKKYLPEFQKVNWQNISDTIFDQSPVYSDVKDIIYEDNSDLNSAKAQSNLKLLKENNTVFIVTGQQLGLLASPLYTIYKIISAIKLADQLNSQKSGFNFVPLFWLESEDHDFEEINHFGVWDKSFKAQKIMYRGENRGKVSIKHYEFEDQIEELIKQIKEEFIETEFSKDLFGKIKEWFKPGELWLTATHEMLKDIFSDTGLLFFKPGLPSIKSLSVKFFQNVLESCRDLNRQFKLTSQKLEETGYPNQVTFVEGKTFLFIENESLQREHIYFDGDSYFTKESNLKFEKRELLNIINSNPDKISTSVVSRPLLQSWLLPAAAYIAGPGEIAYWAQLGGVFKEMKLTMPVVYPRISATIVEPKIQRFINKYGIDTENLPQKKADFIGIVLAEQSNISFKDSKKKIREAFNEIFKDVTAIDPTLKPVVNKTVDKVMGQVDFLENKVLKAKEQKEQTKVSQLEQIHSAIFPEGYPQERYLTFVYYLNKFGPQVFKVIYEKLQIENFGNQFINI